MDPTPPSDDPAARFRRPSQQPQPVPAPEAAAAAPPSPKKYGLLQLVEDTLSAPFHMGTVFARLAPEPPPTYFLLISNAALYTGAFLALHVLQMWSSSSEVMRTFDAAQAAAAGIIFWWLLIGAGFALAAVLHVLARAAGGRGDYKRSYQVYSLMSALWPALAAATSFPSLHMAWIVVATFAAYLAAVAVHNLHGAPSGRALGVIGGVAAVGIAAAWIASVQLDRFLEPYLAAARLQAQLRREAGSPAAGFAPAPFGASSQDPAVAAQQLMQQAQQMMQQAPRGPAAGAPPVSGLDLVSQPSAGQGPAPMTQQDLRQLQQTSEAARQTGLEVMSSVMPMLNNPVMRSRMTKAQAEQMKVLESMLAEIQTQLKSGKPMTPEQSARFQKIQTENLRLMMQLMQQPQAQPPPQTGPSQ